MIDRRRFIQQVGLGVVALSLPELPPWLLRTDEYVSPTIGLRLLKPATWRFVSAAEVDESREEAVVPGGDEAKQAAIALAGTPLLVATRYPSPRPGPTLVVWKQPADSTDDSDTDNHHFSRVHKWTYQTYQHYLRDFRMIRCDPDTFAGRPASCCVVDFGEDTERGESRMVHLESHMLRWRSSWLTFNFLDVQDGWSREARHDFASIESSIELFEPVTDAN